MICFARLDMWRERCRTPWPGTVWAGGADTVGQGRLAGPWRKDRIKESPVTKEEFLEASCGRCGISSNTRFQVILVRFQRCACLRLAFLRRSPREEEKFERDVLASIPWVEQEGGQAKCREVNQSSSGSGTWGPPVSHWARVPLGV